MGEIIIKVDEDGLSRIVMSLGIACRSWYKDLQKNLIKYNESGNWVPVGGVRTDQGAVEYLDQILSQLGSGEFQDLCEEDDEVNLELGEVLRYYEIAKDIWEHQSDYKKDLMDAFVDWFDMCDDVSICRD